MLRKLACLAVMGMAAPAFGALYLDDHFNYTPDLKIDGQGGWQAHAGTGTATNPWMASSVDLDGVGGSMAYPASGRLNQQIKENFPAAVESGQVFFRYLMRLDDISRFATATGWLVRPLDKTFNNYVSNSPRIGIYADPDGDPLTGDYGLEVSLVGKSAVSMEVGTAYEVVWGLDLDTEKQALWIDGAQVFDWTAFGTKTMNSVGSACFVDWGDTATPTTGYIDGLRAGATYAEVVPEPAGLGLLVLGAALGIMRRRR